MAVFHLLATTYGTSLPMTAMALPALLLGLGLGMIGAPLTDLTLGRVDDVHAGSASGLFSTADHLGIALGTVLTGLVFFSHDPAATAHGADVVNAFTATLPYVTGGLLTVWALMFFLPRPVSTRLGWSPFPRGRSRGVRRRGDAVENPAASASVPVHVRAVRCNRQSSSTNDHTSRNPSLSGPASSPARSTGQSPHRKGMR